VNLNTTQLPASPKPTAVTKVVMIAKDENNTVNIISAQSTVSPKPTPVAKTAKIIKDGKGSTENIISHKYILKC